MTTNLYVRFEDWEIPLANVSLDFGTVQYIYSPWKAGEEGVEQDLQAGRVR